MINQIILNQLSLITSSSVDVESSKDKIKALIALRICEFNVVDNHIFQRITIGFGSGGNSDQFFLYVLYEKSLHLSICVVVWTQKYQTTVVYHYFYFFD